MYAADLSVYYFYIHFHFFNNVLLVRMIVSFLFFFVGDISLDFDKP